MITHFDPQFSCCNNTEFHVETVFFIWFLIVLSSIDHLPQSPFGLALAQPMYLKSALASSFLPFFHKSTCWFHAGIHYRKYMLIIRRNINDWFC